MITYTSDLTDVTPDHLHGFFVGWPTPPALPTFLKMLHSSAHVVIARDGPQVVGFATAISDGVPSAYIPLLEVLPAYQGQGIGTAIMRRLLHDLSDLYMVDVMCDDDVAPFYAQLGMTPAGGMILRHYARQAGRPALAPPVD